MYRTPVSSSNICSIGYDSALSILEVEFTSGDVYQYFDVSENLYQQFFNTSSHGQFLNDHIRYNYRYQKVS
ncbi:MAG: KTSC domain-containing protein [bacterium]|nr:KTSC domain-containing protein [bacterium]